MLSGCAYHHEFLALQPRQKQRRYDGRKPPDLHDQNGVYELMVTFDSQLVIKHLLSKEQVDGKVTLTLTGVVDSKVFEGSDTILVRISGLKEIQQELQSD